MAHRCAGREHGPVTLNGVAELMGLDKGQTSRGVSALVARAWCARVPARGRGIRITLSARGADLPTTDDVGARAQPRAAPRHERGEKSEFFEILDRLTRLARTVLERSRTR